MSSLHALVSKGHVHWHMASFKRKTRPSKTDPKTVIPPLPNRRCHHQLLPTLLSMSQKGRKARSIISNDQSQLYYSQPCQWRDHSAGIRNRIRGILEKTSDSLNTPRTDQNSNSYLDIPGGDADGIAGLSPLSPLTDSNEIHQSQSCDVSDHFMLA